MPEHLHLCLRGGKVVAMAPLGIALGLLRTSKHDRIVIAMIRQGYAPARCYWRYTIADRIMS